jgi:hypothetical protein
VRGLSMSEMALLGTVELSFMRRALRWGYRTAGIEGAQRIERLSTAIALWGGLAGVLLWVAVLALHGSFGLAELGFLLGVPVLCGAILRAVGWVLQGFLQGPS